MKIILVKFATWAFLVLTVAGAPVIEVARANPVPVWPQPHLSFFDYLIDAIIAITAILLLIIILLLYRRQRKSINNYHSILVKEV